MTKSSNPGTSTPSPLEDPAAGGRQAAPSPLGPPTGGPDPEAVTEDVRGRATATRKTARPNPPH